jgi:RNA polymerase primary sigma factor
MEKKKYLQCGKPGTYASLVDKFKLSLSEEEEKKLLDKIKAGDKNARNQFVKLHLALVLAVAQGYKNTISRLSGLSLDDLIQEGNIGLMAAVDKYDYELGYKFSTFAVWWIKQKIRLALKDQGRYIRIPRGVTEQIIRYRNVVEELTMKYSRKPTDEEVAEQMSISADELEAIKVSEADASSLDSFTRETDSEQPVDARIRNLFHTVADITMPSVEEQAEQKVQIEELKEQMAQTLTANEQKVMNTVFDINGDRVQRSHKEAALNLNLSSERIRQLHDKAVEKLREANTAEKGIW